MTSGWTEEQRSGKIFTYLTKISVFIGQGGAHHVFGATLKKKKKKKLVGL